MVNRNHHSDLVNQTTGISSIVPCILMSRSDPGIGRYRMGYSWDSFRLHYKYLCGMDPQTQVLKSITYKLITPVI